MDGQRTRSYDQNPKTENKIVQPDDWKAAWEKIMLAYCGLKCLECPVRLCAGKRQMQNCGFCDDYPCNDIMEIHEINPQAKQEIENIFKK